VKTYTDLSWSGGPHSLVYTQAITAGAHVLRAEFTWPGKTADVNGTVEKSFECAAAPAQPPTGGGTTPVGGTPPSGGTTPAGGTTPTVAPAPSGGTTGGGVLPATTVSGRARLLGPSGCVMQAFKARVRGRQIRAVTFFVDGKRVKRITGERSVYALRIRPTRYGFGRHRVIARVQFSAESGTASRRLPLTFRRCARAAGAPRFTG